MRNVLTCALLLLAAPLFATLGTVTYVAGQEQGSARFYVQPNQFAKPVNATGLTAPIARVATVPFRGGKLAIALDADSVQGTQFTCLRLDFTGAGNFTAEKTVVLLPAQGNYVQIKPTDISLALGNQVYPVHVTGYYMNQNNQSIVYLMLGTEARATCAFGDKTHTVRIIDANGNWRFGDTNPVAAVPIRGNFTPGDRVVIDNQAMNWSWYGQPAQVDGQWYQITITPDESTMTVTPFTGPTGSISLQGERWTGLLIGSKCMVNIVGNGQPQTVPADTYHLLTFQEMPDGRTGKQPISFVDYGGKGKVCTVAPNAVATLDLGAPFTARVETKSEGRNQTFSFKATNAAGLPMQLGYKIPFVVTDAAGNKVYENTFESG